MVDFAFPSYYFTMTCPSKFIHSSIALHATQS